ncbi:phosphoribosylamine--glycine ligase [Sporosalibacterium faouarense]|uniref:phosphoribosylamine--glycine ligase n=1 Tax=Sporosalibacterium faouarense TaxID=516123 RepID=UPI00141CC493|nr:phosphoribosylamine--glycine ligase [Sporosalibacterium faouarense]MTI46718.1 phosphoribosylamine--glycine ligase [Bacillota bacterium]
MKILVIGSGAREHTLVWKLSQSEKVSKIFCAPGNGGISDLAECVNIKAEDIDMLLGFAIKEKIDLTVVGPEAPLVGGIVDKFRQEGLKIFGPGSNAAKLEGSKKFSKDFMAKYQIPTGRYESFDNADGALKGLDEFDYPLVIKADGLAAGKGVVICNSKEEAKIAIKEMIINKKFGEAGNNIIIEEFLSGTEASLLCFVAGNRLIPMESARDYKKAYDGDEGLNTGGMGCFSPNPIFTDDLIATVEDEILNKIETGLKEENLGFSGVLFIGLMITEGGPKVLEFNVRMGDPETEVVIPRLKNDLVEVFESAMDETLEKSDLSWSSKACLCVIAASGGYPINYEKDKVINGINNTHENVIVFHGGTRKHDDELFTNGGRVLAVTYLGNNIDEARKEVYKNIEKISFEKMFYRKDIGEI